MSFTSQLLKGLVDASQTHRPPVPLLRGGRGGKEPVPSELLFAESVKLGSRYKTRMLEQAVSPAAVTAPGVLLRASLSVIPGATPTSPTCL